MSPESLVSIDKVFISSITSLVTRLANKHANIADGVTWEYYLNTEGITREYISILFLMKYTYYLGVLLVLEVFISQLSCLQLLFWGTLASNNNTSWIID